MGIDLDQKEAAVFLSGWIGFWKRFRGGKILTDKIIIINKLNKRPLKQFFIYVFMWR